MDFYQILATVGGSLIVLTTLPQVFKTLKLKKVDELSLPMFVTLFFAQGIWFFYGLHLKDMPLIFTNAGSMIIVMVNIVLIIKYRKISE